MVSMRAGPRVAFIARRSAFIGALVCAAVLARTAVAEDPWDVESPDPTAVSAALEQTQADIAALGEPADDSARVRRDALLRRVALLTELSGLIQPRDARETSAQIEARAAQAREEIDTLLRRPVDLTTVTARTTAELTAFDEALKAAQTTLQAAQQALSKARDDRARLERSLQVTLPERGTAAQAELTAELSAAALPHQALLRGNARLEQRIVALRSSAANAELELARARIPLAQAEVDLSRMRYERAQIRFVHASTQVRAELTTVAGQERREAEEAGAAAEREKDPVRRLRRRLRAERDLVRAYTRGDAAMEAGLDARTQAASEAKEAAQREQRRIAERLESGERDDLAGQLLEVRRRVRSQLDMIVGSRLPEIDREIRSVQVQRSSTLERLWQLDVPDDENDELGRFVEMIRAEAPGREAEARIVFGLTVRGQDGLIEALRARIAVLDGNLQRLETLRANMTDRVEALRELSNFVLSRLVWVRSDVVLSPSVATDAASEIGRMGAIVTGPELGGRTSAWFGEAPVPHVTLSLLLLAGFVGLVLSTRTLRKPVPHPRPGKKTLPAIRSTWRAAWRSALLPGYLVVAVLILRAVGAPRVAGGVWGEALLCAAALWFTARFSSRMFRPDGVAVGEFAMQPDLADALRKALRLLLGSALVLALPAWVLSSAPFSFVSLPRLFHTLFALSVVVALVRLLRPSGPFLRILGERAPFWRTVGRLFAPLAIAALVGIAFMEILGYRIGARIFLNGALQTAAFLLLLLGLHQVLKRLIGALAERVRKRAAMESGREQAKAMSETVVSQLSQVALVLVVIAAVFLLGDVWNVDSSIASLFADIELATVSDGTVLTLWNVLCALAFVVFAHFASRNLGAVLDAVVFPAVGASDAGTRYVTLALLRYAILLFGYGAALITLHFSFESIGWALAAISFGLGFGMQEIVANFVSGLILLLERPIRVGDVISVGETGGVVEQIKVRSTVVTNWDRQQIIVPNKAFITANVTNWTRNDLIVRRKINVGVAYGSDVEKVLEILTRVVNAEPGVRKEPAPRVLFQGFGESSLDFEVWLFAIYDQGLDIRSRLHRKIDQELRDAGITIPFPQRDVHLRDLRGASETDAQGLDAPDVE